MQLDFPVSLDDYRFSASPDELIVGHVYYVPRAPGQGDKRTQNRLGRAKLYEMTFADFERPLRREMTDVLGPGGFDFYRHVAGITINRWAHGYSCSEDSLSGDPGEFAAHRINAVKPIGWIAIANSDAAFTAYTHAAIAEGHRAVEDVMTFLST